MNSTDFSTDQLRRALQIKEQIESLQGELNSLSNGSSRIQYRGKRVGARRATSASARARIAAAQRARWAKLKGASSSNIGATRKRRKMSAAGRARIAAAAR